MKKINIIIFSITLLNIFLLIFLILFLGIPNNKTVEFPSIYIITIITFVISVFCIISLIIARVKWWNLGLIYLIFYIIFIFGQVFCKYIFNYTDSNLYDFFQYDIKSITDVSRAILISLYSMLGMTIGILVSILLNKKIKENNMNTTIIHTNLKYIKITAMIILIISTPFALLTLTKDLLLAFNGGYKAVFSDYSIGVGTINERLESFFYIGLLLLMVSNKENIKKAKIFFILTALYSSIRILLGARGLPLLELLFLVITWHSCINKIGKKILIITLILIIPITTMISMMRVVRSMPVSQWINNSKQIIIETLEEQPILSAINEMGTAIYPTVAAINLFPDIKQYKYGSTYWYGLEAIIPNFSSNSIHKSKLYGDIQAEIAEYYGLAFGGSIIEDLYANFGLFCIIAMMLIGFILSKVSIKLYEQRNNNTIKFVLYAAFAVQIVWTVRNNINPIFRYFVWYILTTYILYKVICSYFARRKVGKGSNE